MTMYEILIMYLNDKGRWSSYYERYPDASTAVLAINRARKDHPRNEFKIIPVKKGDGWHSRGA